MKRFFTILVIALAALSVDARKLTILHLNDTHSHIEPERTGDRQGLGGVIEQAAFIDSVRLADGRKNVLLLHAGDFSQGTSYFSELKGNMEVEVLNAMAYDVVCLGNHEFDNGPEELARRLSMLDMPVVCSNYTFNGSPVQKYVKPYTVLKRAGLKIGFVGMLTNLSSVVDGDIAATFQRHDPAESVSKYATYLKDELDCDLVICLSHCGYSTDVKVAASMKDVDIIVGGHSHTYLKEPAVVEDSEGDEVIIVQDGDWGIQVGCLKLDL